MVSIMKSQAIAVAAAVNERMINQVVLIHHTIRSLSDYLMSHRSSDEVEITIMSQYRRGNQSIKQCHFSSALYVRHL